MKTKQVNFVGDCIGLSARFIDKFDDNSIEISYKTFLKNVGYDIIKEINFAVGVPIKNDWCVRFYKAIINKKVYYCMKHSGIHHIWQVIP